jgi:peptidyl-dipeptidase A
MKNGLVVAGVVWLALSCGPGAPTAEEAEAFLEEAEARFLKSEVEAERAAWVQATYITHDSELVAARASERFIATTVELAQAAARFKDVELPEDSARKLELLRLALTLPAPADAAATAELAGITTSLESTYGKGRYCRPEGGPCRELEELSRTMASSRDPDELLDAWTGWRTISPEMKEPYQRLVELANQGSAELGFEDTSVLWRSKYDMPAEDFAVEVDRLWNQVRPLYESLHCHVRAKLAETYGDDLVPGGEPIPAHLLGNMWAQNWGNIYELVAPPEEGAASYDLTELLEQRGVDELEMVRYGERFFTSLLFDPLPDTFWERSLFVKPRDRDVVCHASAWDIDMVDDLRIKMCIEVNAEQFSVIHHELGHNFYQRAYNHLDPLFRNSANDGFHEAVGDTLALSVTPKYLVELGFLDEEPDASADLGLLLRRALDKVAFLPFGLLVDRWRWGVFSGDVPPEQYNQAWWDLREKYQGVRAPVARDESDFDPGAKYHVPANTPYTRYFLAHILQFQFHRDLCKVAGSEGPLHRCSIYGSEEAGKRLEAMLAMGQSRPWPEALESISGSPEMDATAILDYFAPLQVWLDEQNEDRSCGW